MTSDNAYLLSCGCQRAAPISPLSLSVSNKHLFDIFFPFIFYNGQIRPLVSFSLFSHDKYSTILIIEDKSIDGMLGTQTCGGRMVGADESTELWWHPFITSFHIV